MVVPSSGLYSQFVVLSVPRLRQWNLSHLFTSAAERRRSQERGYIFYCDYFCVAVESHSCIFTSRCCENKSQEPSKSTVGGGAITIPLISAIAGLIVHEPG